MIVWWCSEADGGGGVRVGAAGGGAAAGRRQNPTVCRAATLSGQAGLHAGGNGTGDIQSIALCSPAHHH